MVCLLDIYIFIHNLHLSCFLWKWNKSFVFYFCFTIFFNNPIGILVIRPIVEKKVTYSTFNIKPAIICGKAILNVFFYFVYCEFCALFRSSSHQYKTIIPYDRISRFVSFCTINAPFNYFILNLPYIKNKKKPRFTVIFFFCVNRIVYRNIFVTNFTNNKTNPILWLYTHTHTHTEKCLIYNCIQKNKIRKIYTKKKPRKRTMMCMFVQQKWKWKDDENNIFVVSVESNNVKFVKFAAHIKQKFMCKTVMVCRLEYLPSYRKRCVYVCIHSQKVYTQPFHL